MRLDVRDATFYRLDLATESRLWSGPVRSKPRARGAEPYTVSVTAAIAVPCERNERHAGAAEAAAFEAGETDATVPAR